MKRTVFLCLTAISTIVAAADIPQVVSDKQAATEAREVRTLATRLMRQVNDACGNIADAQRNSTHRSGTLMKLWVKASDAGKSMPTYHLKYRARFVYSGCHQMLIDVTSHAGTCMMKPTSVSGYQSALDYDERIWRLDSEQCDGEIAHPDLSRKNAQ